MTRPIYPLRPNIPPQLTPPPPPGPSRSGPLPKVPRATAACRNCHRQRKRCSAERPTCSQCASSNLECSYETVGSETAGQARKRKLGEIQARTEACRDLFALLQNRPLPEASDIFRRIRDGADAQTVLRHVQDGDLLLQLAVVPEVRLRYDLPVGVDLSGLFQDSRNDYADSLLMRATFGADPPGGQPYQQLSRGKSKEEEEEEVSATANAYSIPFRAAEVVDPRLAQVDVAQWTGVHSDNVFLSKLLSLYFLYEFAFFPAFNKDIMLDDMIAGRKRYCSSLMVNAILANACHALATIRHRSEFWNLQNPGYLFLNEARRLWELEQDESRITTIQAGYVLAVTFNVNGLDKIGSSYLTRAISMAQERGLFSKSAKKLSKRAQAVRTTTAWSLYTLQGFMRYYFLREPYLTTPPEDPLPARDEAADYFGDCLVRFPQAQGLVPLYYGVTYLANVELRLIMIDIASNLFGLGRRASLTMEKAAEFYARLRNWYDKLPEPLTARNAVLPTHLLMHMQYHSILMALFEPLAGIETAQPLNMPSASDIVSQSRVCLEMVLYLFYRRHGFECYFVFLLNVVSQLAFSSLRCLSLPNLSDDKRRSTQAMFVLCAKALFEQGRNYLLANAVLQMLRHQMGSEHVRLLRESSTILDDAELDGEILGDQVRADWPVGITSITQDPEGQRLDDLIKSYLGLGLRRLSDSGGSD